MQDFNRFSLDLAKYFQGRKSEAMRFRRAVHASFSGVWRYTPTGQNSFEEFVENWTGGPLGLELANVLASYGQRRGDIKYGITLYYIALTHPDFKSVRNKLEEIFLSERILEEIGVFRPRVRPSPMARLNSDENAITDIDHHTIILDRTPILTAPATNYVGEICSMSPIQIFDSGSGDELEVRFDLNFDSATEQFGDLTAACGFRKVKVTPALEGFEIAAKHHDDEALVDRLAIRNDNIEFWVLKTRVGAPNPYLLDCVFEGKKLLTLAACEAEGTHTISITCSVRNCDLEVEVYTNLGTKIDKSDEQKRIREAAVKLFILDRCTDGGFEGIASVATVRLDK